MFLSGWPHLGELGTLSWRWRCARKSRYGPSYVTSKLRRQVPGATIAFARFATVQAQSARKVGSFFIGRIVESEEENLFDCSEALLRPHVAMHSAVLLILLVLASNHFSVSCRELQDLLFVVNLALMLFLGKCVWCYSFCCFSRLRNCNFCRLGPLTVPGGGVLQLNSTGGGVLDSYQ